MMTNDDNLVSTSTSLKYVFTLLLLQMNWQLREQELPSFGEGEESYTSLNLLASYGIY